MNSNWKRCTPKFPCPICQKPDWCCVGTLFVNCMRIESARPAKNGGWLHPLDSSPAAHVPVHRPVERKVEIDAEQVMRKFRSGLQRPIEHLAENLGLWPSALEALGVAWASPHQAWAFPMKNRYGRTIGIRLRDDHGKKWAVNGSHSGLFYSDHFQSGPVLICEGPTDTAAAMQMGFRAVGRPSCLGCEEETVMLLKRWNARQAVIVADNDSHEAGERGAMKLAGFIPCVSMVIIPPTKDLREFVRSGASKALFDAIINSFTWTQPKKETNA
jgi:hypothetical protein